MFNIGDNVVYPMYGVCCIVGIEEIDALGERKLYYVLENRLGRQQQAMVPVHTAEKLGLRAPSDNAEYDFVMSYLCNDSEAEESANWNQRYRDNTDRLHDGTMRSVAVVFKALNMRGRKKNLSTSERKIYKTAVNVLLSELIHISGKEYSELEQLLQVNCINN